MINVVGTIQYVGRYTKKPVIAETRILDYDGSFVTFFYQDHRSKLITKNTVPVSEFIRRLIRHIPEKNFRMIRHCGLVANRVSNKFKPILDTLFGLVKQIAKSLSWRERQTLYHKKDPFDLSTM